MNSAEESNFLYCFSALSGPLLAIAVASIYCLIPYHNVLKDPCYWYEFQIVVIIAFYSFLAWAVHPLFTEYFAGLAMIQSKFAYLFMYFVACGTYMSVIAIYYSNWMDYAHPMPMNFYIGTSVTILAMAIATLLM